jgi:hypothetical protein
MTFKPEVVALDYETALLDGTPSVEYYRDDFRVTSAAVAWRAEDGTTKTRYLQGEDAVRRMLARLDAASIPVVVHNFCFEYGVTLYRFPGYERLIQLDTMRLAQVADNGGKEAQRYVKEIVTYEDQLDAAEFGDEESYKTGLSLAAASSRFLPPEFQKHKDEAYTYLRAQPGVRAGKEGQHLNLLPPDLMERYNVADAVVTLELYLRLLYQFEAEGYDWRLDHALYAASAKRIAVAKGEGVLVDRPGLEANRDRITAELAAIEEGFRQRFAAELGRIEAEATEKYVNAVVTPRGREGRRKRLEQDPSETRFNIGSGKQLRRLFVDELGCKPQFWTQESQDSRKKREQDPTRKPFEPQPSFRAAHLEGYGEGGEMLVERRKRLLVLQQTQALLSLTERDSRWHLDLKACGTATGRFAGGRYEK